MQSNLPTLKLVHADDGSADARREAMLEAALDCIVTMDTSGRIVDFNAAAERTFGYPREEAQGRSLAALLVPCTSSSSTARSWPACPRTRAAPR